MIDGGDIVIVGAGPAGLACAARLAEADCSVRLADVGTLGGQLLNALAMRGSDAFPDASGPDAAATMLDAVVALGVPIVFEEVLSVKPGSPGGWTVETTAQTITAAAVVIATGSEPASLPIPGADAFRGAGICHCAMCDGPLFQDRAVVVVGDEPWAPDEALHLSGLASSVTLVTPRSRATELDRDGWNESIRIVAGEVVALVGGERLVGVRIATDDGELLLPVDGLFTYVRRLPRTNVLGGALATTGDGCLVVDGNLECSHPGAFAIGDVRAGSPRTLDGALADAKKVADVLIARERHRDHERQIAL